MVVTRTKFNNVLEYLLTKKTLSVDCETTGLRPYHDDHLFSVIIGCEAPEPNTQEAFYFNFQYYMGLDADNILLPDHLQKLRQLFSREDIYWYFFNATFDLAMLAREGLEIRGTIHDGKVHARLEYNDHPKGTYDLERCAERIGEKKDEAVEKYITDYGLWDWEDIPGKKKREKRKHFEQVPFTIMAPYGEQDALLHYRLGEYQKKALEVIDATRKPGMPSLCSLAENERRLSRTVFKMEQVGLGLDREYCMRAARYESDRAEKSISEFQSLTGVEYKSSGKLFAEIFKDEHERWVYTDNKNPSFESDVLKKFNNPVAQTILRIRDAKSKSDFYHGFLYYADSRGNVHPGLDQAGTATGRFSSSRPNFQNLTRDEEDEEKHEEFEVRKCIIPRPGYFLIMPDQDQAEYRLMLDIAASLQGHITPLIKEVLSGKDVHQATADLVKSVSQIDIGRSRAKNGNFAKLYGSGIKRLAETLKCDYAGALAVNNAIDTAAPEMREFCEEVSSTAAVRGWVFNWAGRRAHFPNKRFAYKAPNSIIQGGCADIIKYVMNRIDDRLKDARSRMILQVHDQVVVEVHESEIAWVPKVVHEIMENTYPWSYLPLTAGMQYSTKSLGDKMKGFPC